MDEATSRGLHSGSSFSNSTRLDFNLPSAFFSPFRLPTASPSSSTSTTASLHLLSHFSLLPSYSSFSSLIIVFASFVSSRTFLRSPLPRSRSSSSSFFGPQLQHLLSSYDHETCLEQLGWRLSPVAHLKATEARLEGCHIARRSASESNVDNLDGSSSRSNTLQPLIAGRDCNPNTDDGRHINRARLEASAVDGASTQMRFHPWNTPGENEMLKAAQSQPRVPGTQHIVNQDTENMANGKRKRSIGQHGNTPATLPTVTSPSTLTPSLMQRANAISDSNTPSPYFSRTSITHNEATPPMSPAASPNKKETLERPPISNGTCSAGKVESLKRNLQTQIGLEILMKHNELRLIDQELAKCQIAYEQLRRCTEVPFPATQLSLDVSNGSGPPTRVPSTRHLPHSPAPWGVTDGPYSRHYAKWLLPDPAFDGGDDNFVAGQHSEYARSTRGKPIETIVTSSKRGKSKAPLLPSLPKDKSGPMIIKRKSDGKMVKLRCLDCARDDFGSAQGFINHCRIQHHRSFTSHDAAAAACGEVADVDPTGAIVGAPLTQPAVTASNGAVHPLIRSAHLIKPKPETAVTTQERSPGEQLRLQDGQDCVAISSNASMLASPTHFQASPFTPNLSALIRNRGLGINVQDLVTEVKSKAPLPEADELASDMDIDTPPTEPFHGQHPQIAGSKQPISPTQPRKGGKTSAFGQLRGGAVFPSMRTDLSSHDSSELELEPSPTNESNQAPSLVDDDEDDEYEAQSPTSSSESGDDGSELNFRIEDEDVAGPSNLSPLYPDSGKQQIGSLESRPSAFRQQFSNSREEKHVSFVSPSPAREMSGHDSKRRKM